MRLLLLAAALLAPLAAAAQEHIPDQRFRYLGRAADFAVMATEATGPQTDRRLSVVLANRTASGPHGIDNMTWRMRVDCTGPRIGIFDAFTYLGTEERSELHDKNGTWSSKNINPGSANEALVRFACTGEASEKEPQWLTGDNAARAFALARAHEFAPSPPESPQ